MPVPAGTIAYFYFTGPQSSGWEETVCFNEIIPANMAAAGVMAVALANDRVAFLTSDCTLTKVVLRTAGPPKDSLAPVWTATLGSIAGSCNQPQDTIETRFQTGSGLARSYFAHGVSDGWVSGGTWTVGSLAAYGVASAAWRAKMISGDWALKRLNVLGLKVPIVSVISAGLGQDAVVTTSFAHGLTGVKLVQIRGYRGDPNRLVNGFWRAAVTGANTLVLGGSHRYQFNAGVGATVQEVLVSSTPIITENTAVIGERKVGRPFGLPRGRRSPILLHS